MKNKQNTTIAEPDQTAVRTALWRALHVQIDSEPHIIRDLIGLKLVAPQDEWQQRPDMKYTKRLRASVVARARFIEDQILEHSKQGISQYVILGSGLDTFVQRRPDIASKLRIYEIDQPDMLNWKEKQLIQFGFGFPDYLHFVSVDFEVSSWYEALISAGFNTSEPAFVACTGVSLYLTGEAITSALKQIATLAPGSRLAMSFYLPSELLDDEDKPMQEIAEKGAHAGGTPFVSFFKPDEIFALARLANFKEVKIVSTKDLEKLYFSNRADNLMPASGEVFLLAKT